MIKTQVIRDLRTWGAEEIGLAPPKASQYIANPNNKNLGYVNDPSFALDDPQNSLFFDKFVQANAIHWGVADKGFLLVSDFADHGTYRRFDDPVEFEAAFKTFKEVLTRNGLDLNGWEAIQQDIRQHLDEFSPKTDDSYLKKVGNFMGAAYCEAMRYRLRNEVDFRIANLENKP